MNTQAMFERHDRATRGGALSADERAQLQQWYAEQDQAEAEMLARAPVPQTARLRAELDEAMSGLVAVSQHIQSQSAENEALRCEITALERRLAERTTVSLQ
jgi:hypothetical protein